MATTQRFVIQEKKMGLQQYGKLKADRKTVTILSGLVPPT